MSKPDWTEFTLRIFINKPLKSVYNAWSIPAELSTWFLEIADYKKVDGKDLNPHVNINAGDTYSWKWNNWDIIENGNVIKANGKDEVSFTFGKAGNVHVKLKETPKGTEITLIQDEIPTDEESKMEYHVGCRLGWAFWMTNLKAWLEQGTLLNAKGYGKDELRDLVNS